MSLLLESAWHRSEGHPVSLPASLGLLHCPHGPGCTLPGSQWNWALEAVCPEVGKALVESFLVMISGLRAAIFLLIPGQAQGSR